MNVTSNSHSPRSNVTAISYYLSLTSIHFPTEAVLRHRFERSHPMCPINVSVSSALLHRLAKSFSVPDPERW